MWTLTCSTVLLFATLAGAAPPEGARTVDPPARPGAMAPGLALVGDTVLLSWLEPAPSSDGADGTDAYRLRAARWTDGGWGEPWTIVQRNDLFLNWADVPSVAATGDGSLVAHWLQTSGPATYAYDVMLARSADRGVTWQPLGPAHDDGTATEHGFVSMVPDPGGVRAFWLDGREMSPEDEHGHGSGDMTLRTALVGRAVGAGQRLDERVCECCNTAAAVTERGPIIVYRNRSADEIRDIFIVRRTATGWSDPRPVHRDGWSITGCPVNGPAVAASGRRVAVAWFTGATVSGAVKLSYSDDGGETFTPPVIVDRTLPLGRVDVILEADGGAIVSWLDQAGDVGAVTLARVSADGRVGPPLPVAEAGLTRRSGFPRIAPIGGRVLVVWTDDAERTAVRALTVDAASLPAPPAAGQPIPSRP